MLGRIGRALQNPNLRQQLGRIAQATLTSANPNISYGQALGQIRQDAAQEEYRQQVLAQQANEQKVRMAQASAMQAHRDATLKISRDREARLARDARVKLDQEALHSVVSRQIAALGPEATIEDQLALYRASGDPALVWKAMETQIDHNIATAKKTERQERIEGLRELVAAKAEANKVDLNKHQISHIALQLDESGSLLDMDNSGNAIIDKVLFEIQNVTGGDTSKALFNVVNPYEQNKRINEGVAGIEQARLDYNMPQLESALDRILPAFEQQSEVPGFNFLEQTVGDLSNDAINQLFMSEEGNANRQALQALANMILKARSGSAVTVPEQRRVLIGELGRGVFRDSARVRQGLQAIQDEIQSVNRSIMTMYPNDVVDEWQRRQNRAEIESLLDYDQEGF